MKDKIIMLILGIVIGAVLAGVCFWFATSINQPNMNKNMQGMERGNMRQEQMDNTISSDNSARTE